MAKKETIEDLFRDKLEGAEIRPSETSWHSIQRSYRVSRFFRFRPRSLNIYYLGALGLAAAGILWLSPEQGVELQEAERVPVIEEPAVITKENSTEAGTLKEKEEGGGESQLSESLSTRPESPGESAEYNTVEPPSNEGQPVPEQSMKKNTPAVERRPGMREDQAENIVPVADFSALPAEGCVPLRVQFSNSGRDAGQYAWDFGDGSISSAREPVHVYEYAGTYTVTLKAMDDAGNEAVQYGSIEVHPCPKAALELLEGLPAADGSMSVQVMNYSSGGVDYNWQLLDAKLSVLGGWSSDAFQPELYPGDLPEGAQWIRLVVTSNHQCSDTSLTELPAADAVSKRELRFATAFEANRSSGGYYYPGEQGNDIFHPVFPEQPADYHLQVFSRTGVRVFESRDLYRGWDGYIRQERATAGVYLWICEGTWNDGEPFSYKGDVTLFWSDGQWP